MQSSTPWPVPGALLWVVCAPSLSVEDEPGILRTMAGDRSLWYRQHRPIPFRDH